MPIFPSSDITGIPKNRFYAEPPDYGKITDIWEYEDGGRDFNEVSPNAPRRWEYGFTGLSPAQAAIFDTFYDSVRRSIPFKFRDKYNNLWTNVYVEEYSRTHEAHKSWIVNVSFRLVNYDGIFTDGTPPMVEITSPAAGNTVSGTIIVSATAMDNIAVARVEFYYFNGSGFAFIGLDSAAPYSVNFNTSVNGNGTLVLSATAFDLVGNASPADFVTVTVFNDLSSVIFGGDALLFGGAGLTF